MSLTVAFHDVGHGQAIHILVAGGPTIVVDLGSSSRFSPLTWLRDITQTIDLLVVTHPHGDHISEMLEIANLGFQVRQFWRPKWLPEAVVRDANQRSYDGQVQRYLEMSSRFSATIPESALVGNPAVSKGLSLKTHASTDCGESNINNHSGVVVLEYLGVKMVIPGDNEPPSWRGLLQKPEFRAAVLGAKVFMASHHGRESGFCAEIVDSIQPAICVVSDREVSDTDASAKYYEKATGWLVHSRLKKQSLPRYVISTRRDGLITAEVGSELSGQRYLQIECL